VDVLMPFQWWYFSCHPFLTRWQMVRNLGHPVELLKAWLEDGTFQPRTIRLKKIGGFVVDRYPPHSAG